MPRKPHRSIEADSPTRWLGWDKVLKWHADAKKLDEEHRTNQFEITFVSAFVTGGRVSELLQLRPNQISITESRLGLKVERMEVLKRRKRVVRTFYVNTQIDKLALRFLELAQNCHTYYLLPARQPFSGELSNSANNKIKGATSRFNVYKKVSAIEDDDIEGGCLWPHLLRDQKAYQLSAKLDEGGQEYDPYDLRKFFEWKSLDMPAHYVGRREELDMARAAGIPESDVS